jgi:GntR family histidine utilization transcriptional repressor
VTREAARAALQPDAPEPLYEQVKRLIVDGIRAGTWGRSRVPSESALVQRLGVSRMTVHRALRELKAEGLIVRVPGRGTFVSVDKPRSTLLETQDIAAEIRSRGSRYSCRVESLEETAADSETAVALGLRVGAPIYHSAIVHEENGVPVQFEERWVNPAIAPGYLDQDFTRRTPHAFLMESAPLTEVEHVLHAVLAEPRIRTLLRLTAVAPCLLLVRRTWSDGVSATRSVFVFPGDRYSLGGRYRVTNAAEPPALGSVQTGQVLGAGKRGAGRPPVARKGRR